MIGFNELSPFHASVVGCKLAPAAFRRHLDNDIDNATDAIIGSASVISCRCGLLKENLLHIGNPRGYMSHSGQPVENINGLHRPIEVSFSGARWSESVTTSRDKGWAAQVSCFVMVRRGADGFVEPTQEKCRIITVCYVSDLVKFVIYLLRFSDSDH